MPQELAPSSHQDLFSRLHLPPADQWPVFLFDRPEVQYPAALNAAVELIEPHLQRGHGNRVALHGRNSAGDFQWTYHELNDRVDRIAHVLTGEMGLVSGNRLLLRGANSPMMAACWLAAVKAGLVVVPTMPLLRAAELKKIIDKAEIHAALCAESLAEELQHCMDAAHPHYTPFLKQVLHFGNDHTDPLSQAMQSAPGPFTAYPTSRDDVCLIAFTSGTTGNPKGTMHFHRDILVMSDLFPRHILHMGPDDIVCGTPPIAFTFGLGGLLTFPLRYGASAVLLERHTPETLLQTIERFHATQCYTAPTFYRQMAALSAAFDLRSLRHPVSAGEALPDATRQLWKTATGIEITDGIGGTEVIHIYIASAGKQVRPGFIGQAIPGYVAQIVDDDMIISAGYNIAGPEVEGALLQHPAVAECGVVGDPDEERGQVVTAYVVLKTGHEGNAAMIEALQDFVKANIAPFKYPRRVHFVTSLPRTETGKLQRFKLRQMSKG